MGFVIPKVSTEEMAKRRTELATVKNPKHYGLRPSERTPTEPRKIKKSKKNRTPVTDAAIMTPKMKARKVLREMKASRPKRYIKKAEPK